ncbi:hypothetical protein ACFL2Q_01350 [Thermodesulfobacteriota bacterium]
MPDHEKGSLCRRFKALLFLTVFGALLTYLPFAAARFAPFIYP